MQWWRFDRRLPTAHVKVSWHQLTRFIEPSSSLPIIAHCESTLEMYKVHIWRLTGCPGIIIILCVNESEVIKCDKYNLLLKNNCNYWYCILLYVLFLSYVKSMCCVHGYECKAHFIRVLIGMHLVICIDNFMPGFFLVNSNIIINSDIHVK